MTRELIDVALVLSSFEPGGTERQMTELIRRLDPQRFRVHVACFRRTGAWLPRVEEAVGDVAEFRLRSFKSPSSIAALLRFANWLRQRRIAVLHACDLYANIFAIPAAALARVPVRIGSRRELSPPDKTTAHLTAQRLSYRLAHRVVSNSTAAADRLVAEGVARSRITVIPNGIDIAAFAGRTAAPRKHIVTTVANLRPEKGHDVLLRAAAIVRQRIPGVTFRIVGDGPLRDSVTAQAARLGVSDIVEILGHRDDVPALLAQSDAFAFPSRTEAFPNGVIEAMAAGLPVVATATGGILELIDSGSNGRLVPVDDADALAQALCDVLVDAAAGERLGTAARETVARRYSFDRMVDAFEDLYESELAGRVGHADRAQHPIEETLAARRL